jgi:hypothetical protein
MKISKFVSSALVALVAIGLFAPEQAKAQPPTGMIRFSGNVMLTFDDTTNTFSLDFSSVTVDSTTGTDGFANITQGTALNLATLPIDAGTHVIDPEMSLFEWFTVATGGGEFFEFNHPAGKGLVRLEPSTSSVFLSLRGEFSGFFEPHPSWFGSLKGTGTGETIPFSAVVGTPESGSALGLLALGLVAVEGLRRKTRDPAK